MKGAQKLKADAAIGDFIVDPLPPIEFGRIAAQAAKQVIFQKVRDAERERHMRNSRTAPAKSSPASSSASSSAMSSSISAAPRASSAAMQIPREMVRVGDRIRSLILRVLGRNPRPADLAAHPDFMKKLFAQEVPEIYDGIIEIKAAARDPAAAPRSA